MARNKLIKVFSLTFVGLFLVFALSFIQSPLASASSVYDTTLRSSSPSTVYNGGACSAIDMTTNFASYINNNASYTTVTPKSYFVGTTQSAARADFSHMIDNHANGWTISQRSAPPTFGQGDYSFHSGDKVVYVNFNLDSSNHLDFATYAGAYKFAYLHATAGSGTYTVTLVQHTDCSVRVAVIILTSNAANLSDQWSNQLLADPIADLGWDITQSIINVGTVNYPAGYEGVYIPSTSSPDVPSVPSVLNTPYSATQTKWDWADSTCTTGTANYQYKYTISPAGYDSGWVGTSTSEVTFTTSTPEQNYNVIVQARCTLNGNSSAWTASSSDSIYGSPAPDSPDSVSTTISHDDYTNTNTIWTWVPPTCSTGTPDYLYRYTIDYPNGYNSGWIETSSNFVDFTTTTTGSYNVVVQARCTDGVSSSEYASASTDNVFNYTEPLQIDYRMNFNLTGTISNFTASILPSKICEFGITDNCKGNATDLADIPEPSFVTWFLRDDSLVENELELTTDFGLADNPSSICNYFDVTNNFNTATMLEFCSKLNGVNLDPSHHYSLYAYPQLYGIFQTVNPFIYSQAPTYNIQRYYNGLGFDGKSGYFNKSTVNNSIDENGVYNDSDPFNLSVDCADLYPITWGSLDNVIPLVTCSVTETVKNIFIKLSDFITWLFVPSWSSISPQMDSLSNTFTTKLGFIATPVTFITNFYNSLLGSSASSCSITFGSILGGSAVAYNFCQFETSLPTLFAFAQVVLIGVTSFVLIFALYRKFIDIVRSE